MSEDARFSDGRETPLNLGAFDTEDLSVLSALVQDCVLPVSEISWRPSERRLALLVNRFRWEDRGRDRHGAERVQSVLAVNNALTVASQGIARNEGDTILSILSISFEETDAPGGQVLITLAGDGVIRAEVEALDLSLRDVTRPYRAPSRQVPRHPED